MSDAPRLDQFHPNAVLATGPDAGDEPELAVDEIQGNVLPGFGTAGQILLGVKIEPSEAGAAAARRKLAALAPRVSTLRQVHTLREVRRAVARSAGTKPVLPDVLFNVVLVHAALAPLGLPADAISDGPYVGGMAHTNLQDPINAQGDPVGWVVGATADNSPDILFILGSDDVGTLTVAADALEADLGAAGLRRVYRDLGRKLPGSAEHFGFRDDISHPGVRGRLSARPDHVLTRRYLDPADFRARTFARPGQPLLWPGQFLFGYPTQTDDPEVAGLEAIPPHPWMRHGSFLAFRRLRQDVGEFRRFAVAQAVAASTRLGRAVSADEVQAWVVGRWPDGTPVARSPGGPDAATATDEMAVNFFASVDEEPAAVVVEDGVRRTVLGCPADAGGLRCPHFAHVRKVNPRRQTDQGPATHFRMLRRGIPYGPPYDPGEPAPADRGLLFLAYMRSLEKQFLTVSATWMNSEVAPEGFGHDLLLGQARAGEREADRFEPGRSARLTAPGPNPWVIPTGGGFFFSPALSVLAGL
jgi:Dyp-type peroxidase family